ncbi:glycosyltransferase [Sporolactobacillus shoreicorticis]|uniref:Glycosyltransferase n=1 Tax=Sporolactobacillus shoreicorticis TaxID=1923877 RepID=A0ABW5S4B2_9BACL|nr:glycosyltransferase [Sporolactobacillus shoreicorticis]MCO7127563.1 glycosyltransferase [Sporolactobacillus shoreicorticis]
MKDIHVIVGAGTWQLDGLRYRRHRLAEFLASQPETKHVVWICPSPKRFADRKVGEAETIEQWTITDMLPHKCFRFTRYLSFFHKRRLSELARLLKPHVGYDHLYLWYTFPGFSKLGDLLQWDCVIYDRSDLWAAPISGRMSLTAKLRRRLIANSERKIVNRADMIFCTSDYLHHVTDLELPAGKRNHVVTLENGVDYVLFGDDKSEAQNTGIVLGYIGGIKPKLDFALLRAVARRKPDWQILLVGPDGTQGDPDFSRLLEENNVRWIDAVPPEEVPHYMSQISIGLMPYKASPYNNAVFPLKLFEFLASGKAAVGIHLPSTKKYEQASAYLCLDSSDPELLIQACEHLESVVRDPEAIHARKEFAKTKDWPIIFSAMLDRVHEE